MLTYEEAIAQILIKVPVLAPQQTSLLEAQGLILAEDILAPRPIPPFANSAMDGFAAHSADLTGEPPFTFPVVGEVAAGASEIMPLTPGTVTRIMTGAPLPKGADTIIPIEDTLEESAGSLCTITESVSSGQFVREAGSDVQQGETVVTMDTLVRPAEIAMCAAVGRANISVYPRPKVAIISTGDELVNLEGTLQPGQIYDSNAYALAAQVVEAGGIVTQRLRAQDTPESLRTALDACAGADVILTSGGVSVGGYDYVKTVFAERGTIDFWRVSIRPGKPLVFGTWDQRLFFGLPGNPVSSLVTFELFVRPALLKMRGQTELSRPTVQAVLTEDAVHEPGRRSYQRGFLSHDGDSYFVHPTGDQSSHRLRSTVAANALLVIPTDVSMIPAGDYVTVLWTDGERLPDLTT